MLTDGESFFIGFTDEVGIISHRPGQPIDIENRVEGVLLLERGRAIAHARLRFGVQKGDGRDEHRDGEKDELASFVRTDLALEAQQLAVRSAPGSALPGVHVEEEDLGFGSITRIEVLDELGSQLIGKAVGAYSTLHVPELLERRRELGRDVSMALADEVKRFMDAIRLTDAQTVLVVGLGNWNATPDNVGPLTTSKLLVTRHLHEYGVLDADVLGQMRPVAALSPGVLGLTGVETAEIVRGVVDRIRPDLVICVDALASMSVDRIGTTFQLSNVGINPGSGVGNTRQGLTRESLGVPVLVIGCPTVIYATTIVSEALDRLQQQLQGADEPGSHESDTAAVGTLDPARIVVTARDEVSGGGGSRGVSSLFDPEQRAQIIHDVLGQQMGRLVVTPKEVDLLVETLTDVIADGLNEALHPGVSAEEAAQLR